MSLRFDDTPYYGDGWLAPIKYPVRNFILRRNFPQGEEVITDSFNQIVSSEKILFQVIGYKHAGDTHAIYDAESGMVTIPVTGTYEMIIEKKFNRGDRIKLIDLIKVNES